MIVPYGESIADRYPHWPVERRLQHERRLARIVSRIEQQLSLSEG